VLGLERCERPVDEREGRLQWVRDEEIRAVHYGTEMEIGVVYRAVAQFDGGEIIGIGCVVEVLDEL
jgi:hypothetical protein